MVEESEPAMASYLNELLNLVQSEMAASTLCAELQKAEKVHDGDDWKALIITSGWRAPERESGHHQNDWIERKVPSEAPAFLENLITIFPTHGKLEKGDTESTTATPECKLGMEVFFVGPWTWGVPCSNSNPRWTGRSNRICGPLIQGLSRQRRGEYHEYRLHDNGTLGAHRLVDVWDLLAWMVWRLSRRHFYAVY